MLEVIFGNSTTEKVLLYIDVYREGYGREIADTYEISLISVQKQLERFEIGGVLVSRMRGRTRIYQFNPRYFFLDELKNLLKKAKKALPEDQIKKYYRKRTRPRRKGKPL